MSGSVVVFMVDGGFGVGVHTLGVLYVSAILRLDTLDDIHISRMKRSTWRKERLVRLRPSCVGSLA